MAEKIKINRAPVLTLWAAVVAEQMGYPAETALTLGKALAGLNAQSKGQRLGIYEPSEEKPKEKPEPGEKKPAQTEPQSVRLLGRPVPVVETERGLRAAVSDQAIDPHGVERYLQRKFGANLDAVRQAMQSLARSIDPQALDRRAFALYEQFRPSVPEGTRGWGAAGELDLEKIEGLKEK